MRIIFELAAFEVGFPFYGVAWWFLWGVVGPFLDRFLTLSVLSIYPFEYVGLGLAAAGFLLRFWCASLFKTKGGGRLLGWERWADRLAVSKFLVTEGPYRYTRNPTYIAALMLNVGFGLFFQSIFILAFTLILASVFHLVVVYHEEKRLEARFGPEYVIYKMRVPRWFPRVTRIMQY